MFRLSTIIFILSFCTLTISCLNILVFCPLLNASHKKFMAKLADTLTDAGHNVTFLIVDGHEARKSPPFIKTTKDVYIVERDEEMIRLSDSNFDEMTALWTSDIRTENFAETHGPFRIMMKNACANFLRNPNVVEDMKKRNFDLAITEALAVFDLAFFKKLGIEKYILSSSCSLFDHILPYIGEPLDQSYVPALCSDTTEKMTIFDRYENQRLAQEFNGPMEELFDAEEILYKKYLGDDLPGWRELMAQASLYFTNSNPYIDFPRPVIQKTVAIGGISVDMNHIRSQKMPEEWDKILNLRKKSMLISFGTIARSMDMPILYKQTLFNVIRSLPDVTFIWKYESDETQWAANTPNLIFTKWAPQTALLLDPRLTAFLTHGGLGSVNELSYCGKPALMIPIFSDQPRNSNMLARHGGVIVLNKKDLGNEEKLRNAVKSILHEENYQKSAKRIAELLENQPLKPTDLFVKHAEFVGKFGPFPQMDPHVRHLNYFQRTFLDIYLIIAFCYISIGLGSLLVLKYLFSKIVSRKNSKKE